MAFVGTARTHVGRQRALNEDAFLSRPDIGLWVVADGMGGHERGEVASAAVIDAFAGAEGGPDLTARSVLARISVEAANRKLLELSRSELENRTVGATVVALMATPRRFMCLWAGDSRAYHAHGGRLTQLTRDHSLVQQLVDAGHLDPAAAAGHPNANVITRAVGVAADLEMDAAVGAVAAGDTFLVASDGLTRLVSEAEILAGLEAADLEAAADRFIDTALERGAPDNVTLVLARAV